MVDNSETAIELRGALKEALRSARLIHRSLELEHHPPLEYCECKGAVLYRSIIEVHGDECSICRRRHGLERIHECE
jgi:hypothetical protein